VMAIGTQIVDDKLSLDLMKTFLTAEFSTKE